MLKENQFKRMYIDIDIPYGLFMELFKDIFEERLKWCCRRFGVELDYFLYERSQNGNVHVFIRYKEPVNPSIYHRLMFCVGDDHKRIVHSYKRYIATGQILDFFWNRPVKKLEKKRKRCWNECREDMH